MQCAFGVIAEQFETGHVDARQTDSGEKAEKHGGPESRGEKCKPQSGNCAAECTEQDHAPRVEAVGNADENRDADHVARIVDGGDPAGFGVAQPPHADKGRQQGRKGGDADQG